MFLLLHLANSSVKAREVSSLPSLRGTGYNIHLIRKNSAVISSLVNFRGMGWIRNPPVNPWWLPAAARGSLYDSGTMIWVCEFTQQQQNLVEEALN